MTATLLMLSLRSFVLFVLFVLSVVVSDGGARRHQYQCVPVVRLGMLAVVRVVRVHVVVGAAQSEACVRSEREWEHEMSSGERV